MQPNSRSNAMMSIYHASNTVKTESVKLIFIHPEPQITQKKSQNLVICIVEESAIPQLVSAFATFVEIQMICAVKLVQAIENILRCMAVNDIEKHHNTKTMGCVNELFQV